MPILDSVHGKSPRFLEKVLAFLTFLSTRNFLKNRIYLFEIFRPENIFQVLKATIKTKFSHVPSLRIQDWQVR